MKRLLCLLLVCLNTYLSSAQSDEKEKRPFQENLFTGGSISLSLFGNTFLIGGSPVFGYSLTNFMDLGVVANYTYASQRDYNGVFNAKLRQSLYGGGGFARIYPVRFLFVQAQVERNAIQQKYIPPGGAAIDQISVSANSTLVGAGYTTGRRGRGGAPFYYLSVMWDLSGDVNSPYTDAFGRSIPIVRGGIQIPLFQGQGRSFR